MGWNWKRTEAFTVELPRNRQAIVTVSIAERQEYLTGKPTKTARFDVEGDNINLLRKNQTSSEILDAINTWCKKHYFTHTPNISETAVQVEYERNAEMQALADARLQQIRQDPLVIDAIQAAEAEVQSIINNYQVVFDTLGAILTRAQNIVQRKIDAEWKLAQATVNRIAEGYPLPEMVAEQNADYKKTYGSDLTHLTTVNVKFQGTTTWDRYGTRKVDLAQAHELLEQALALIEEQQEQQRQQERNRMEVGMTS